MAVEAYTDAGRVAARLARHLDMALAEVDLSLAQYRVLMYLEEGAEVASVLAEKLAITRPSVTNVVDGLVARGLVERQTSGGDRRKVGHAITCEGRRVLSEADLATTRRLRGIAEHLSDDAQVLAAFDALKLWRAGMDACRAVTMEEVR